MFSWLRKLKQRLSWRRLHPHRYCVRLFSAAAAAVAVRVRNLHFTALLLLFCQTHIHTRSYSLLNISPCASCFSSLSQKHCLQIAVEPQDVRMKTRSLPAHTHSRTPNIRLYGLYQILSESLWIWFVGMSALSLRPEFGACLCSSEAGDHSDPFWATSAWPPDTHACRNTPAKTTHKEGLKNGRLQRTGGVSLCFTFEVDIFASLSSVPVYLLGVAMTTACCGPVRGILVNSLFIIYCSYGRSICTE